MQRVAVIAALIAGPSFYLEGVTGGGFDTWRLTEWDVVISGPWRQHSARRQRLRPA
jgi:hypothetical protein